MFSIIFVCLFFHAIQIGTSFFGVDGSTKPGHQNHCLNCSSKEHSSSSEEEHEEKGECIPTTKDATGQSPVGVLLNATLSEIYSYVSLAGTCNCSSQNRKFFFDAYHMCCNIAFPFGRINCRNLSQLCVLSNGQFYTPVPGFPNISTVVFFPLCAADGRDCKMYISFIYPTSFGIKGLSMRSSDNGTIWQSPSTANPVPIGPLSGLLPVDAMSCHGCAGIQSSAGASELGCKGTFELKSI